jgi:precorrin-6Y C5,15-methyltransferase (decarboxylating)
MANRTPWLSIIGIGEDGLAGLTDAARAALSQAEIVFGGPRHLALAGAGPKGRAWPVPFSIAPVLDLRGRPTAILASGDPFWHGAGGSIAAHLTQGEWQTFPAASVFSQTAAHLGWRIEETTCIGLHAAPFARLLPHLTHDARLICTLRDGPAAAQLATWLTDRGFGASALTLLESLGGPDQRIRQATAATFALEASAPVAIAIHALGPKGLPRAAGLPDDAFAHDGQITKRPIRALTLSALAPRAGERLWDLGAGSGSISVEWCLATPTTTAICVEAKPNRTPNIRANAETYGLSDRMTVIEAPALAAIETLPTPDAVFIGGGADDALLSRLWSLLPQGTRLVVNAVTLDTESLLVNWSARHGGTLTRIEIATATPLGTMRGWTPSRAVAQWSVTR